MSRLHSIAILMILTAAVSMAQKPSCSLVPGWPQDGPARTFNAENLFEYMDGNAEGYVVYDFVKMDGVNCKKDGVTLVFDVSEMADREFAYGIFMSNRDPPPPGREDRHVGAGYGAARGLRQRQVLCRSRRQSGRRPHGGHPAAF